MLSYLNIFLPKVVEETISIHKGNCLRQRFKGSDCSRCFEACPSGALSLKDGQITWDQNLCQTCLICCAVCPTGGLTFDAVPSVAIIKKLHEVESPVLACSRQGEIEGHAQVPCFGIFADPDLLLALTLALKKPLKLNMTRCQQCHNSAVIHPLKETVRKLPAGVQVKLIFEKENLEFVERQCDRREFFKMIRPAAKKKSGIVDRIKLSRPTYDYVTKRLPASRELLLQTARLLKKDNNKTAELSWPVLKFNNNCKHCNICAALCPTGALAVSIKGVKPPTVIRERCVACGLCEEFCPHSGVQVLTS